MKKIALILCILSVFISLSFSQKTKKKVHKRVKKAKVITKPAVVPVAVTEKDIQQGICGSIFWKSGNMMPSPDREMPKAKPVQREILVYELTNISEATLQDGFYTSIVKSKIKSIKSDSTGKFCLDLPEGDYSLFVQEGSKGLYANSFDGQGNIFPVKVNKDKVSIIVVNIDYQAVY